MRNLIPLLLPFSVLLGSAVNAQTVPNLSIADRSRLVRDLTPTPDFFKQGQAQFEREIRLLERRSTRPEDLLKVDPKLRDQDLRLIQRDRSLRQRQSLRD